MICGIDPSYNNNNGIAFWSKGKLSGLASGSFSEMTKLVLAQNPKAIVLEDSRLDKKVLHALAAFNAAKKKGLTVGISAAAMAGRNVGKLDGACERWVDFAKENGIKLYHVRPSSRRKNVDLKLTAKAFKRITGYEGRTNEHERDAAMLVYKREL